MSVNGGLRFLMDSYCSEVVTKKLYGMVNFMQLGGCCSPLSLGPLIKLGQIFFGDQTRSELDQ